VRQVPAVVERHRQHLLAGRDQRHVRGHVGLRAAVRLHVRGRRAEEFLRAAAREVLDRVDVLAAAVVAPAGIALGVLVRQHGAARRHHLARRVVLGRDQLELALLAPLLELDRFPHGAVRVERSLGLQRVFQAGAHASFLSITWGPKPRP
jgi:hypothetical protein